jgi:hypothetical protein
MTSVLDLIGSTPLIRLKRANRYMGKLFNPEFLRAQGLPTPPWLS